MLLDALRFVIGADTRDADGQLTKLDGSADSLEKALNSVDETSSKASLSLATMAKAALGSLTAALSLGAAWTSVVGRAADINELANAADAMGESVENVDAFGRAIQAIGGDAGAARDSMGALAGTVTNMLKGLDTESGKTFGFLGVQLKDAAGNVKGTTDLMLELSGAVQGMSKSDATFHLNKLGIGDPKTIEAMLRGRKELERLIATQKAAGTISKESVENARKFNESLGTLRTMAQSAGAAMIDKLVPYVQAGVDALRKMVDWVKENETLVTGFFLAVGTAVAIYFLPAMFSAAAATLVAIAPFLAIGAAVVAIGAAFALAYEDVMAFLDGQESFIGKVFDKYPAIKALVFGLVDAFKAVGGAILQFFMSPMETVMKVFDWLSGKIDSLIAKAKTLTDWIPGFGGSDTAQTLQSANAQISAAAGTPLNNITSSAISNSAVTNSSASLNIGEVRVETQATDASGVAGALGSELQEQLRSFAAYNQTAVAG